jgi:soluble lytic murein transglycosylase-like protein
MSRGRAHRSHPHHAQARQRRKRRGRRVQSMLIAGAALVAPNAATRAVDAPSVVAPEAIALIVPAPASTVTTSATYRLPPEHAFEDLIQTAAARYALTPALIRAVIRTESAFDPLAVSSAGAQGLMQLMPALAAELGVADAFDPHDNIMGGTRYLSALIGDHHGNVALALASYNAGPSVVEHYGGIPPFEETRRYVRTILDLVARGETDLPRH